MCFSASVRHFCLSLNSCAVLLLYHTWYFVSYYFSDLNCELCIIRYCCSTSTTFLICTAVRSIVYTKYFEVLLGTFFLISILNSVLLYWYCCFSDLNSLTKILQENAKARPPTMKQHGRWQSEGGQDRKRSSFVETKEVSCLLLLSFYLICTWYFIKIRVSYIR